MRSRGDHDLAPLERLLKELKKAADARDKVWQILDDRLGIYENLDLMIWDLESRLTLKPVTVPDPFPVFVRKVFQCCREAGLKPTRTGRVYDERSNKPSWFQKFMATLNANVLGNEGRCKRLKYSRAAFYAEIAKALSGDNKSGRARK